MKIIVLSVCNDVSLNGNVRYYRDALTGCRNQFKNEEKYINIRCVNGAIYFFLCFISTFLE